MSICTNFYRSFHSGPENLKKSRQKTREIALQKLIFGHFWDCKKIELGQKNFFVKLIYLISCVFWPGLFSNFLAHSIYREWWFFGGISMSSQSEIILERIFWLVFSSRDHMCDVKIVNYTSRLLHLISGMLLKSFSSSWKIVCLDCWQLFSTSTTWSD